MLGTPTKVCSCLASIHSSIVYKLTTILIQETPGTTWLCWCINVLYFLVTIIMLSAQLISLNCNSECLSAIYMKGKHSSLNSNKLQVLHHKLYRSYVHSLFLFFVCMVSYLTFMFIRVLKCTCLCHLHAPILYQ